MVNYPRNQLLLVFPVYQYPLCTYEECICDPLENRKSRIKDMINKVILILITLVVPYFLMVSRQYEMITILGASIISVILTISFVGIMPSETLAQGTNATNATNATSMANATSAAGEETTVVMPLGSSAATSGAGYEPPEITVSPGATLMWDNKDNALHTATSGESPTPDGKFDSGIIGANQQSKPVTMPTEPGEYKYFCTLHPFLQGTVIVQ
jgi:plastocyanin